MESLSSREMPGSEDMFMVNDPSLNFGRKLLPSERNITKAKTSNDAEEMMTVRVWSSTQSKASR